MGTINLVWCKLASGNVWWVGEKLDEIPEELATAVKNKNIQVVKFFDPDEAFHTVKNPSHIVPYETDKEDYITKGLKLLKKKPQMLQNFKNDVAEAEKKIGGDENIIERLEPKPADSTPRKSIVAEIFKTPVVEEKAPEKKTPPSAAATTTSKAVKKTGSPRKPKGPTPQIQTDNKKLHCEKCGFGTDRMNVLIQHLKTHTDGPTTPAVASTSTPRASRVSTPTPQTPVVQPVRPPSTRKAIKSTPKTTPVAPPKRVSQPRKRKLASSPEDSKPEVAKDEILADWSDGEEDVRVAAVRETRKKAKTSKDLFDSLFQSKVSSDDGTEDSKPPKLEDSSSNDRRSDDDMDIDELPMLSGSSALVNLPKSSPVQDKKDEVNAEIKEEVKDEVNEEVKDEVNEEVKNEIKEDVKDDVKEEVKDDVKEEVKEVKEETEDFDTQFNELMSETAFKLPTFPSKSEPIVGTEKVEEQVETTSAPVEVASKIEEQIVKEPEVKISTEKLKAVTPRRQTTKTEEAKVAETPVQNVEVVKPASSQKQKPTAEVKSIPSTPKTSVSPVKTYSSPTRQASPAKAQPGPPTPKSPTKTVAGAKATPTAASASTVKTPVQVVKPDASSTPVYARKSAPKPIEPEPARRTSARGRRPSAKAAEAAEAAAPVAPAQAKVAESVVATKSKPLHKLPTTPAEPKVEPTPVKTTASTEALKVAEPIKSSAPAKEQKALPETPKRTSVSEPVVQKVVADTVTIPPSPATSKPVEASLPTETPKKPTATSAPTASSLASETPKKPTATSAPTASSLATETPKKPTATSAPTASSLALAQRKQQQQQRGVAPAPPPAKRQSRTYPGKKSPGASESPQTKPTATVKPTVNVEDDSIIRQALQVQKGAVKSTPTTAEPKKEVPVEHVVHLVPVQNPDGSVSYMLLSLNDSDQLQLDQFEGQAAPSSNLEAVYIDKPIDGETLMTTINPSAPVQPQQQIQLQLPQIPQSAAKQPTASQQVKQIAAAAAKASTAQPHLQATQFVTTEAAAPQQYIIQQDGQEGTVLSSSLVQNEDGSFVDISQLASGDNNIYFMTEDGAIIDPSGVNGIDFQQLFNTQ